MSSERKTLKVFFMPGLQACTSWWPSVSSVTLSTLHEQAQCMVWLAELQSLTAVQHHFRTQFGRQPPTWKNIWFWDNKLRATGSLLHVKSWKKQTSEENVNRIREAFQQSQRKSIHAASLQVQNPCSTVHDVLHKRVYKIHMIHALKLSDQVTCTNLPVDMIEKIDGSPDFLHQACFFNEATFHVRGVVYRYNCGIWGSQNPHVTCEFERGSPKVNV
jgi:hypothetical protein